jgi:hypothetical protein
MKTKTPFKNKEMLIRDIENFLKDHSALFHAQGSRISHFFEMNCYNYVVKYYENQDFDVAIQNLKNNSFRYKISAHGNVDNFSFFTASKIVKGIKYEFEIHHNLSLECAHASEIFFTADISVIKKGTIERMTPKTYRSARSHCKAKHVQTLFEVKHLSPFPELLFSFSGIPENFIMREQRIDQPKHLAPSLLVSGKANSHSEKIKDHLEFKYKINIIFALFSTYSAVYSKLHKKGTIGTLY